MVTKVRKPTIKQKKAIANIVNGDSTRKAMIKAGYSVKSAKNPKTLTESPVFLHTLENWGISDDKLAEVLIGGLSAEKSIVMGKDSADSFVDIQPDHPTRLKALEIALKLKGYSKDSVTNVTNNNTILPILVKFINGQDD